MAVLAVELPAGSDEGADEGTDEGKNESAAEIKETAETRAGRTPPSQANPLEQGVPGQGVVTQHR
jgi:hypothetical protein